MAALVTERPADPGAEDEGEAFVEQLRTALKGNSVSLPGLLHEVARILRTTGDTITSPLPHGRHQAYVEQEGRVAQALKAERAHSQAA